MELLAWAAETNAWILEDDYDSEFRATGRPLPSLKSLDRGQRVLHAGSFSKTLFPALRLGYLVVPPELAAAFHRAARLLTLGQPTLEQCVVAAFMQKGHYTRHIRRMRTLYGERRRALTQALQTQFGPGIDIQPTDGGLHLLARFPGAPDDTTLAKAAATAGLAPSPLSALTVAHDHGQALLLGFTNIAAEDAQAAAARLAASFNPLRS
jgi:GntR family transcriptional regulator/MocR family aminotransferase